MRHLVWITGDGFKHSQNRRLVTQYLCNLAVMTSSPGHLTKNDVVIEIGGIPIALQTADPDFISILKTRFGDFFRTGIVPEFSFSVELTSPNLFNPDADADVWMEDGEWHMERGDFRARWSSEKHCGHVQQSANPYSIDSVLRLVHTLILARSGGFLLHASSGIRNGKAFLFSGLSEAGKTTMARLAPPDVQILTDEVSYVKKIDSQYVAYGTPFAGELGKPGKNVSAPIAALYLLAKAPGNSIEPMAAPDAIRRLMRNVLFFARDPDLVRLVFAAVCAFVDTTPIFTLSFYPDQRVWDLIG